MGPGPHPEPDDTSSETYSRRLQSTPRWKRLLDVQAPYRWNLRHQGLGRTLDIGCGVGRNLRSLRPDSVGVDHNVTSVEVARSLGLTALSVPEWERSELRCLEAFDGILLAHVVEHLSRSEAVELLSAYLPYLRPGGRVFLVCPQERGYASDPTHATWTTGDDLERLARTVGLDPRSWYSFPFPRWAGRFFTYNEFCVLAVKDGPR